MQSLKNQNIMVTGASQGIGADVAQYLSQQGAKIAVTYLTSKNKAQKVFQNLEGQGHLLLQLDITKPSEVKKSFNLFIKHFGYISALINNAGIIKDSLILRMKDQDFDCVIKTNLYGSFYCSREAIKYMVKQKKGNIINISSVMAQTGNSGQANYVSSKAALEGLTRSMAQELAIRNIRVNAIAPGFINTSMTQKLNKKQMQIIINKIPLKKIGTVQDISKTISFLLNSHYITGQVISVNGGLSM